MTAASTNGEGAVKRPTDALRFVEDEYPGPTPKELLESLAGVCWALSEVAPKAAEAPDPVLCQLALAAHVLSRQAVARITTTD